MHTLIDANGVVDLSAYPALLAVTDGVILDIKAWGDDVYKRLTGVERKAAVEKNIRMLAQNGKLFELRLVCAEGWVDVESAVFGITRLIPDELAEIPLKLIRFRNHGVKGLMSKAFVPTDQEMGRYRQCAESMGFRHVLMR